MPTKYTESINGAAPQFNASSPRLIDKEVGTRTRPMRVLSMGFCRTGCMSMRAALMRLGYRPYHGVEIFRQPERFGPLWQEALEAKFYGRCKPWGRAEFDKVLGDFDAVEDVPCVLFARELVAAYPDAKVILTTRDPDHWLASMRATIFALQRWRCWWLLEYFDPLVRSWYRYAAVVWTVFCADDHGEVAKQSFLQHAEHVRAVVPEGRLLEFEVREGWGPLCAFLGVEVPGEEFPRVNDAGSFPFAQWEGVYRRAAWRLVAVLGGAVAVGVMVVLSWFGR